MILWSAQSMHASLNWVVISRRSGHGFRRKSLQLHGSDPARGCKYWWRPLKILARDRQTTGKKHHIIKTADKMNERLTSIALQAVIVRHRLLKLQLIVSGQWSFSAKPLGMRCGDSDFYRVWLISKMKNSIKISKTVKFLKWKHTVIR